MLNASDPRIRSGVHFIIFLIIAIGVSLFILQKAKEAIAEIDRLSEMPAIALPRKE